MAEIFPGDVGFGSPGIEQAMTQDTLRLGLVAGRLQKIDKLKHVATARPPFTGTERGVSNREGDTNISASRNSARNRFLLHCHPLSGTPVGSNTETDDDCRRRQFSIGELTVQSSLLDSTVTVEKPA